MQSESFWRWLKTVAVLLAMTNAGMNLGIFSPTFPDMAILMSSTNGQMATTMTWVGLASIIGALCMGPLFDRFDGLLVLGSALLLQGLVLGVAPWFRILIVFQVLAGVASIFNTGVIAGSMAVNCIIWKKKPEMISPIIQVTDLFHVFGTALTPQVIRPFIGGQQFPVPDVKSPTALPHGPNLTSFFGNADWDTATVDSRTTNSSVLNGGPAPVQIAYVLMAVLSLIVAVICLAVGALDHGQTRAKSYAYGTNRMVRSRSYSLNEDGQRIVAEEFVPEPSRERTGSLVRTILQKNFNDDRTKCDHNKADVRKLLLKRQELQQKKEIRIRNEENDKEAAVVNAHGHGAADCSVPPVTCNSKIIPLLVIVLLFFTVNGGRDAMFTGLLFTLLNGYLHWTPHAGTLLVTFYHVTRVVIHVAFVLLARCVSPVVMTVANIVFLLVSAGLMLATINSSPIYTVLAVILTGFATSNIHPTAITMAQKSFQVDGKIMGTFIGGIFLGTATVSLIVGWLLDAYGAISFPVVLMSLSVAGTVLFVIWLIFARADKSPQTALLVEEIVIANEGTPLIGA